MEVGRRRRAEVRGLRAENSGQRADEIETDKDFKGPSLMDITAPDNHKGRAEYTKV